MKIIIMTAVCLSVLFSAASYAQSEEEPRQVSPVAFTADLAVRFFQIFISPIDDRRCIFSPTCSVYARQAIAKYGFIRAYPLIAARLIRCNPSAYHSRVYDDAAPGKGGPCYDPVP